MANLYCMHLKRNDHEMRKKLISYCLENQVLALGWSFLFEPEYGNSIHSMQNLVSAATAYYGKEKKPVSLFSKLAPGDLIWTRDLDGVYYLCQVLEAPIPEYNKELDIGATVKVDIRKVGISVPGTIVHRFSTPRSPTIQRIVTPEYISEYSHHIFGQLSGQASDTDLSQIKFDLFELLDGFDLEELVIDYLQITRDYYLSKNSVARNDSTIKIECELYPRNPLSGEPCAVLQVKGGDRGSPQLATEYQTYASSGKKVFLFFSNGKYGEAVDGIEQITRDELTNFAKTYRRILPPAISYWIDLCFPE